MENNKEISKGIIIKSFIWTFLERGGAQFIRFIISIILARLLLPAEYGTVALITIFMDIANIFIQSGFGSALIQKQDVDNKDFSTVFFFSLFASILCYAIIFFCAPVIANFYNQSALTKIIRILSLSFFSSAINILQYFYIAKHMQFKKRFFSSTTATLLSGTLGIILAFNGFGVWALVWQQLSYGYFVTLVLWPISEWRPEFYFSFKRLKSLLPFSIRVAISDFIDVIVNNLYGLFIGKKYTTESLGLFDKGQSFPKFISTNLGITISSVMFPTLSNFNNDTEKMKKIVQKTNLLVSYIIFPCMVGLIAISVPLVNVLLTEKWLDCVFFMRIASLCFCFSSINTTNIQTIMALGYSGLTLKLNVIKKTLAITILLLTLPIGIKAIALGQLLCSILEFIINTIPNKKLINYGFWSQLRDFVPNAIISFLMVVAIHPLTLLKLPYTIVLSLQIILGILFYILISVLTKNESFTFLYNTIKNKLQHTNTQQNT